MTLQTSNYNIAVSVQIIATYRMIQNFGGRKSWQIARDLPKFSCQKISFLKAEVAQYLMHS